MLLFLVVMRGSARADVLVSNNFEDASMGAWEAVGSDAGLYQDGDIVSNMAGDETNATYATSPTYCIWDGRGSSYLQMTESMPLIAKGYTDLTISFNYKIRNALGTRRINTYFYDGSSWQSLGYVTYSGSKSYSLNSGSYTFTDEARFRFTFADSGGAAGPAFIDDVVITATPDFTGTYWDLDGSNPGAGGASPSGTWDVSTAAWNTESDGTGATGSWAPGLTAVFAAGTTATGAYTVTVSGTPTIGGLVFEEGTVNVNGGGLQMVSDADVYVAAGLTTTIATPFSEDASARAMTKTGGGTLILSGNNVGATGGMTLNDGITQFESASAINGTARDVTVDQGATVAFGASFGAGNIPTVLLNRIVASSEGTIAADNYAGIDFDFSAAGLTAASLGAVGTVAYTGTLTPNGGTYRLGGGGGTLAMNSALSTAELVVHGPGTVQLGGNDTLVTSLASSGSGVVLENGSVTDMTLTVSNSVDCTYAGVLGDGGSGTLSLVKADSGKLTLSGNCTYTGATIMDGGTLDVSGLPGDPLSTSSGLVVTGTSTFIYRGWDPGYALPSTTVNPGVIAHFKNTSSGNGPQFTMASLSGAGTFSADNPGGTGAGKGITFGDMSAFTGVLQYQVTGAALYFSTPNLNDTVANRIRVIGSAGDTRFQKRFIYTGSSDLTLTNRAFELGAAANSRFAIENDGTGTFTIERDLLVSSAGNKSLELQGTNTGDNEFAGAITNGVGATISVVKAQAGTWILSGANTYSGDTTVSGGTLILRGQQCLPDGGVLNIDGGTLQLDDREMVGSLQFSGVSTNSGVWGAVGNSRAEYTDSRFTGPDLLYVGVDFPPTGTVLLVR
jgi:fibronectin-binding autotransporter adhesin